MKKQLFILVAFSVSFIAMNGQQWEGSTSINGSIFRNDNVGIGTTAPLGELDLNNGRIVLSGNASAIGAFTQHNNVSEYLGSTNPSGGNKGWNLQFCDINHPRKNNFEMKFWNGSDWIKTLTIQGNGNVGIGTVVPGTAKLAVNGNVGIGATTPLGELDVNNGRIVLSGNASAIGAFTQHNNVSEYLGSTNPSGGNKGWNLEFCDINHPRRNNFEMKFWNGTDWLRAFAIQKGGNIGVGTVIPLGKLDVNDGRIVLSGGASAIGALTQHHNGNEYLGSTNPGGGNKGWNLQFRDESQVRSNNFEVNFWNGIDWIKTLTVQGNGNVGIGTVTPGYELDVSGTIRAEEVKVNLNGADFVFDDDYNLRSLEEVETFIKTNKHLPDIAPAEEMETDGADLGEMNSKLLQKVEELTLYVIEHNKQQESQQELIKQLLEENKALRDRLVNLENKQNPK